MTIPIKYAIFGDDLEPKAIQQMDNACSLPISKKGALMPDCHTGYGLPVGGVLGTYNAVIPYAVGVDISCSVSLSVFDISPTLLLTNLPFLQEVINKETRFGVGAEFVKSKRREHAVLEKNWSISPITKNNKDKAWAQLGTSGSGNHFVEFGIFEIKENAIGVKPGNYLSLLSHSGSRGTGAQVCTYYSQLAQKECAKLPSHLKHLAWLSLETNEGQEYWQAMLLMHAYASANHELIHQHITAALGAKVIFSFMNSHNLAWEERHGDTNLIVHRKGATPASAGQLGIIPGSMCSKTFLVRGKGNEAALRSCSHGAGRVMSRTKAKKTFDWHYWNKYLHEQGVTLMSAGIDEMPGVYKDIYTVMEAQKDLVEIVATFEPKLVKMAQGGQRAED